LSRATKLGRYDLLRILSCIIFQRYSWGSFGSGYLIGGNNALEEWCFGKFGGMVGVGWGLDCAWEDLIFFPD